MSHHVSTEQDSPVAKGRQSPPYFRVLPPYPTGWFLISFSKELKKGQIKSFTFQGMEVVLYRTDSGNAHMLDAYCSHMGAHMGKGGSIEGELIKCPFHGFCFDKSGKCVKNAYGTKPSPKTLVRSWHIREFNGLIMAFYNPKTNHVPDWEIPELDWEDWSDLDFVEFKLKSHPQETAENSVDIGHLKEVHGYQEVKELRPLHLDGPFLNAKYFMNRPAGILGKIGKNAHAEFEIFKYGLGYSAVEVDVQNFGLRNRHFVFPTPIDGEYIYLRIALSLKKIENGKGFFKLAKYLPFDLRKLIMPFTLKQYAHDVSQDFDIWQNKIYINPPVLAKGDGPIFKFRKWAEQFY